MEQVVKLYPITFPIPECKIIDDDDFKSSHSKNRWLAFIRPDRQGGLIFIGMKNHIITVIVKVFLHILLKRRGGIACGIMKF